MPKIISTTLLTTDCAQLGLTEVFAPHKHVGSSDPASHRGYRTHKMSRGRGAKRSPKERRFTRQLRNVSRRGRELELIMLELFDYYTTPVSAVDVTWPEESDDWRYEDDWEQSSAFDEDDSDDFPVTDIFDGYVDDTYDTYEPDEADYVTDPVTVCQHCGFYVVAPCGCEAAAAEPVDPFEFTTDCTSCGEELGSHDLRGHCGDRRGHFSAKPLPVMAAFM